MNSDERDEFVKEFAKEPRNLLILGPTGSGKTSLLKMIDQACWKHYSVEYSNAFELANRCENPHTMTNLYDRPKCQILLIDNAQVVQNHRNFDWIIDSRWDVLYHYSHRVTVIASTSAQFREMTSARLEHYQTIKLEKRKEISDDTIVS